MGRAKIKKKNVHRYDGDGDVTVLLLTFFMLTGFYVREERAGTSNDSRLCIRD